VRSTSLSPTTNRPGVGPTLAAARTIIPAIPQCPAPFIDATVVTVIEEQSNTGPSQFPTGFYAIFHL